MTDPKRWLDEGGGGTAEERALLEVGRNSKMPSALRKRVWLGVAGGIAGVGASAGTAAGGAVGQGTAAKGTLSLLFSGAATKTVLAVAVLGGAGVGVTALRSGARPTPAATTIVPAPSPEKIENREATEKAVQEPAVADTVASSAVPQQPKARAPVAPHGGPRGAAVAPAATADDVTPPRTEPAPETHVASRLREESAAVVAVRKTLLSGEPAEALRMLDRLRSDFPNGALVQEREALTVRALVEAGQKDAARKRGDAFLRAFPRSPHAAEVRALLGP
jgi:hypothetical protein